MSVAAVFLLACALQGASPHMLSWEAYDAKLSALSRYHEAGDLDALRGLVAELETSVIFEVPAYEWRVYEAALKFHDGDVEAGFRLLREFEAMINIDAGLLRCDALGQAHGAPYPLAYQTLCSEIFLPYYDTATPAQLDRAEQNRALIEVVLDRALGEGRD